MLFAWSSSLIKQMTTPLTLQLEDHLQQHHDNADHKFDPVLRRFTSVTAVLDALVSCPQGHALITYLLDTNISSMATDTEKFDAFVRAPGAQVCAVQGYIQVLLV
jgi:hypothetical protein